MILSTLQRIATMMDAEEIEASPVLVPGGVTAAPEDMSRYLEKTVVSTGKIPLSEEELGVPPHKPKEEPQSGETTASQRGTSSDGENGQNRTHSRRKLVPYPVIDSPPNGDLTQLMLPSPIFTCQRSLRILLDTKQF